VFRLLEIEGRLVEARRGLAGSGWHWQNFVILICSMVTLWQKVQIGQCKVQLYICSMVTLQWWHSDKKSKLGSVRSNSTFVQWWHSDKKSKLDSVRSNSTFVLCKNDFQIPTPNFQIQPMILLPPGGHTILCKNDFQIQTPTSKFSLWSFCPLVDK
jgi:hypothetical protein